MVDAPPETFGPEARIGIFRPFEVDCYLVTSISIFDSDEDVDLFSFDHFYKILIAMDSHRYQLMNKQQIKDAMKVAKRDNEIFFDNWKSTNHDSPRHKGARDGFRREYTDYLLNEIKVENPLVPPGASDRIIAGLRRNLSLEVIARGLNGLYRQQRDPARPEETQTYSSEDVDLVQEYLKFKRDDAYVRWNAVAYNDATLVQMVNELTG